MSGSATNGWEILKHQCRYEVNRNEDLTEKDRARICAEKMEYWKQVAKQIKKGRGFNSFLEYNPLKEGRIHGNSNSYSTSHWHYCWINCP